ncbi:hypothetical protein CAPTEDRAFT_119893 [Capitella teleta]|uniref:Cationic amino acid transporter C-terminal domain-containing protein n=1 Tax=Capitella teleta TaxID=283909 RepID=R7T8K1_CAPTE|nr:hypothetical protein CAPTEDRAFT_119893 [Capitella teleta]|eukprot:ELT89728.1 hypothetical protein CAPTEDRAFT_119893 [Capitella teleta]
MPAVRGCLNRLIRRKVVDFSESSNHLERCLSAIDLIALGIGCTLGAGIYVVAGQVARQVAGPSVVLSFLVAAVASMFAGLCYAEFGARVPKAGSAYIYSYVTLGELSAFMIGWTLVLEYIIGTSSVARSWTSYVDSLANNAISDYFLELSPMTVPSLAAYPDFLAFGLVLFLTCFLLLGAREPTLLNTIFTMVNLLVVAYIFISGLFQVDIQNWNISAEEVCSNRNIANTTSTDGKGGFFPFGVSGMLSGAATAFYAFIGFDVIATTGEEAKNPQRDIPLGIVVSLTVCAVAYCGISSVLTLMIPYYNINVDASLPDAFKQVGWGVAQNIITVGAVCGLSTRFRALQIICEDLRG